MAMDDGEAGLALDLTLRQARTLLRDTPDGRISSLERRRLRDAAEQSPQGARLSVEIAALARARRATAAADEMLHTAQTGARRIEQLLDELRSLAVEAAKTDRSDHERALLDARFQDALAALDRAAAATTHDGQDLVDAAFARLVPVGTTALTGAATVDGGTGTFTAADSIPGTGVRNLRLNGVRLAAPRTVVNNGTTFPAVRRFDLELAATAAPTPATGTVALRDLRLRDDNGAPTAVDFQGSLTSFPAITAAPTAGGDVRIVATTFTTLTLDATRPELGDSALLDVTAGFRATVPAAGDTATGAYLGRRVTPLAFHVGTGTQPAADEVAVNLDGLTPGALALQDVQLGTPRRAERAERLVGEATAELQRTLGEITGGRQRLAAAADAADQQRDGLIAAREAIVDPEAARPINQRIAQRIVAELDIGIGLGGRRLPENVYGPLFGRAG